MKRPIFIAVIMIAALPSFADSVTTIALQDNGFVSVPLGTGLDPLLNPTSSPSQLTLISYFGPIGAVTFSSTLNLAGHLFTFGPITDTCTNPSGCGEGFGWTLPLSYKPLNGTLTVDLNGVTHTYDFRYQSSAPEPSSMITIGSGLMIILYRKSSVSRKHNLER